MENYLWILWLVLGVVLIIGEIFTFGFVLFWFGIGAIAAALAGGLGVGFLGQFAIFAIVSVGLTLMSRTIFSNYLHDKENELRSGADALPGQIGTVTATSKGVLNEAAVKVFGSTWTAFPIDDKTILNEGDKVEVVSVRGSSIYVKKADQQRSLPNWRDDD